MLKANSKKARENIRNYIVEATDFKSLQYDKYYYVYDTCYKNVDKFSMWRESLRDCVYNEKVKRDLSSCGVCSYSLFKSWLQGLPFALGDYYYFNNAVDILGDILEETEEVRNKFTEEQAAEKLTSMIYRELYLW